jgi:4-diphosphocytidyl-2-C-methyl-D-erythritol kinase
MESITLKARAKINLTLDVLNKRRDGYHNLRMTMQSLLLHDTVTLRKSDKPGMLRISCDKPELPTDRRNIVYRAVEFFLERYGLSAGLTVRIVKRIPISSGLGGGSSDCAAAGLGLTVDDLRGIGLRFGADVPFCVTGGTMLAEGVGEVLTELPPFSMDWIVLACLPIRVSTAEIFERFSENKGLRSVKTQANGGGRSPVWDKLSNDLTPITASKHPEINDVITQMMQLGASDAEMSGSGPSVFGLFESKSAAQAAAHTLSKTIKNVYITRPERMRMI